MSNPRHRSSNTPYALRPLPPPGPGTPLFENHRLYLGAHIWHNDHTEAWLAQLTPEEAQEAQVQYESDWYEVYTTSEGSEVFKDHVMGLNEVAECFLQRGESAEEFVGKGFGGRMERFVGVFLACQAGGTSGCEMERGAKGGKGGGSGVSRKRKRSFEADDEDDGDDEYRVGQGEEADSDDDGVAESEDGEEMMKKKKARSSKKPAAKSRASKKAGKAPPSGRDILAHFDSVDACNPWADLDGDDEEVLVKVKHENDHADRYQTGAAVTMPQEESGVSGRAKAIRAATAKRTSGALATHSKGPASGEKSAACRKSRAEFKKKQSCAPPPAKRVKRSSSSKTASTSKNVSSSKNAAALSNDLNATANLLRTALIALCSTKPTSLTSTPTFLTALGALSLASTAPRIAAAARKVLSCLLGALETASEACRREEKARNEAAEAGAKGELLTARVRLVEVYREEWRVLRQEWENWDGGLGELEEAVRHDGGHGT